MRPFISFILFIYCLLPFSIYSDKILLKDGKLIEGILQQQNADEVHILKKNGERIFLPKSIIKSISYEEEPKEEPKSTRDTSLYHHFLFPIGLGSLDSPQFTYGYRFFFGLL